MPKWTVCCDSYFMHTEEVEGKLKCISIEAISHNLQPHSIECHSNDVCENFASFNYDIITEIFIDIFAMVSWCLSPHLLCSFQLIYITRIPFWKISKTHRTHLRCEYLNDIQNCIYSNKIGNRTESNQTKRKIQNMYINENEWIK